MNNKPLSDCTRKEATDILQEAGDVVTLRVQTSNLTGNVIKLSIGGTSFFIWGVQFYLFRSVKVSIIVLSPITIKI